MRLRLILLFVLILLIVPLWHLHQLNQNLKQNKLQVELQSFENRADDPAAPERARSAIRFARDNFGEQAPELWRTLDAAATLLADRNEMTEAVLLREELLVTAARHQAPETDLTRWREKLASLYLATGRAGEAERLVADVLGGIERSRGKDHLDLLTPLRDLARIQKKSGRLGIAADTLRRAAAICRQRKVEIPTPLQVEIIGELAGFEADLEHQTQAVELYREAVELSRDIVGAEEKTAGLLEKFSRYQVGQRQWENAESTLRQALNLRETKRESNPAAWLKDQQLLADLLHAQGRMEEMLNIRETLLREVERIGPRGGIDQHAVALEWAEATRSAGEYHVAELRLRSLLPMDTNQWTAEQADIVRSLCEMLATTDRGLDAWILALQLLEWTPDNATVDLLARVDRLRQGYQPREQTQLDARTRWEWNLMEWRSRVGRAAENLALARIIYSSVGESNEDISWLPRLIEFLAEAEMAGGNGSEAARHMARAIRLHGNALLQADSDGDRILNKAIRLFARLGEIAEERKAKEILDQLRATLDRKMDPAWTGTLAALVEKYRAAGNMKVAEPLALRLLNAREAVLGPDHPAVRKALKTYAEISESLGRLGQAELSNDRAVTSCERELVRIQRDLAAGLLERARLAELRDRPDVAQLSRERALTLLETLDGSDNPAVVRLRQLLNGDAVTETTPGEDAAVVAPPVVEGEPSATQVAETVEVSVDPVAVAAPYEEPTAEVVIPLEPLEGTKEAE